MSVPKVTTEVKVYEVNGDKTRECEPLLVKSHGIRSCLVVICAPAGTAKKFTVDAADL